MNSQTKKTKKVGILRKRPCFAISREMMDSDMSYTNFRRLRLCSIGV